MIFDIAAWDLENKVSKGNQGNENCWTPNIFISSSKTFFLSFIERKFVAQKTQLWLNRCPNLLSNTWLC
jgi:hypothetical protein